VDKADGGKTINILLVEDNPLDVEVIQEVFKLIESKNRLFLTKDGEEALDFVYHRGKYQDTSLAPVPDLILLDIRMPKIDGLEVLRVIKSDENLKRIPVLILTVSDRDADIRRAYEYGANSYIVKPIEFWNFANIVTKIEEYWFTIAKLPLYEEV